MPKTEEQKSNIKSLIGTIESSTLMHSEYLDSDGCMCAVGHIAKYVGALDVLVRSNDMQIQYHPYHDIIEEKARDMFGFSSKSLTMVQELNDTNDDDDERKQRVIEFLKEEMER